MPEYLPLAPRSEVVYEQLIFLVLHQQTCGAILCAECDRLKRAESVLLERFE